MSTNVLAMYRKERYGHGKAWSSEVKYRYGEVKYSTGIVKNSYVLSKQSGETKGRVMRGQGGELHSLGTVSKSVVKRRHSLVKFCKGTVSNSLVE